MTFFKPSHDTIQAQTWHDSSTLIALFKPSRDTIQAQSWHYSSTVTTLFKHSHGTIQDTHGTIQAQS
jgi:hypothetical protein